MRGEGPDSSTYVRPLDDPSPPSTVLCVHPDGATASRVADGILDWSSNIIELTEKVRTVLDTLTSDEQPDLRPVSLASVVEEEVGRVDAMAGVREIAVDGPGVPESQRDAVFDRGAKGSGSSGTGFGLFFVASMTDIYGGDVRIEDSDAGGAAFLLDLPAA